MQSDIITLEMLMNQLVESHAQFHGVVDKIASDCFCVFFVPVKKGAGGDQEHSRVLQSEL